MSYNKIIYAENDRVKVDHETYGPLKGTVRGLASPMIVDIFIIELDDEIDGYPFSCITAQVACMETCG